MRWFVKAFRDDRDASGAYRSGATTSLVQFLNRYNFTPDRWKAVSSRAVGTFAIEEITIAYYAEYELEDPLP